MRGLNEDELLDFAGSPWMAGTSASIELMPILGRACDNRSSCQPRKCGRPSLHSARSSHARRWRAAVRPATTDWREQRAPSDHHAGERSLLLQVQPAQADCDGKLAPLSVGERGNRLRSALRAGASPEDIRQLILKAVPRSRKATAYHRAW